MLRTRCWYLIGWVSIATLARWPPSKGTKRIEHFGKFATSTAKRRRGSVSRSKCVSSPRASSTMEEADPLKVRFTHDKISPKFRNGDRFDKTIQRIPDGGLPATALPPMLLGMRGQTDWRTDTPTDRQTDRQTGRATMRERKRERDTCVHISVAANRVQICVLVRERIEC